MIKKLEQIQEEYGVPAEIGLDGIAKGGSVLPHIVEDEDGKINQVTLCSSISGGQGEILNMPNEISLIRYKWINGEIHEFRENYKSDKFILSQGIKKIEESLVFGNPNNRENKTPLNPIFLKTRFNNSKSIDAYIQTCKLNDLMQICDSFYNLIITDSDLIEMQKNHNVSLLWISAFAFYNFFNKKCDLSIQVKDNYNLVFSYLLEIRLNK
jgi:hypothetical protein